MAAGFTARTQKPGAGTRASQARDEGRHHLEIHIPRDALGVTRGQRPFPDEEILREFVASRLTMKEWPKKVLHTERKWLQKIAWNIRRKTTSKIGVRRIDYPFLPEFSKPYLMSAGKITTPKQRKDNNYTVMCHFTTGIHSEKHHEAISWLCKHPRVHLHKPRPTQATWHSLLLLGHTPAQHVTAANCNTMRSICISKHRKYTLKV